MLETGTNRSKYQFIPNKSKFIPGTNPSEALSPLLRLKISWSLCWERRDGGIRNGGCWRDQRRKAWNHDSHGGDVITMLFLGLKTKNTVAIKIWDNMYLCTKKEFILSPCVKKYEHQHFRFISEYDMVGPPKIRNNGPSTCYSRDSAGKIGKGGEKSRTWRSFMGWVGAWGPDVSCRAGSRVTWLHPSRLWRAPHLLLWVTKSATSDP